MTLDKGRGVLADPSVTIFATALLLREDGRESG